MRRRYLWRRPTASRKLGRIDQVRNAGPRLRDVEVWIRLVG